MPTPHPETPIEPRDDTIADADLVEDADGDLGIETEDILAGFPVPLDVDFEVPTVDAIEQHQVVPDEEDAWEHQ